MSKTKARISKTTLESSGLNENLSKKDVARVHVIVITKNNGELAIPLAHEVIKETPGKGYAWISGHVENKDNGDIFKTASRELYEETGIKPSDSNFSKLVLVKTEKYNIAIPVIFYLDRENKYSNISEYKGDGEKSGWILYSAKQFFSTRLQEYKKALYGEDADLTKASLYFNDKNAKHEATFKLEKSDVLSGKGSVGEEFRVCREFDKTLGQSLVATDILGHIDPQNPVQDSITLSCLGESFSQLEI